MMAKSVILRQASKIANSHQRKIEAIFRRILAKVAEDAARDGRKAKKKYVAPTGNATLEVMAPKTAATKAPDIQFLGYESGIYFEKYRAELEAATNDELFAFLRRIATLIGADYILLRTIWANEFMHRAQAVSELARIAAESIGQRSFKTGRPLRIADNTIRTLSSTANGGSNSGNGAAGNTERPTHAGQDPAITGQLTEAVGSYVTQYSWIVGHPMRPYPPHQELEGLTWFSWQELDELTVKPEDSWLLGSVYFPGDHDGCQCEYEIEFVPQSEAA